MKEVLKDSYFHSKKHTIEKSLKYNYYWYNQFQQLIFMSLKIK